MKQEYRAYHVCSSCQQRLSEDQRMYNNGVCPWCGHKSQGTICDTIKLSEVVHLSSASGVDLGLGPLYIAIVVFAAVVTYGITSLVKSCG